MDLSCEASLPSRRFLCSWVRREHHFSPCSQHPIAHEGCIQLNEHDGYLFRDVDNVHSFTSWSDKPSLWYTFPASSMCDESWLNYLYNYLFWISPSFSASDRNSLAINSGNYSGHWNQEQNPRWKIMENPCSQVCPNTAGPKRTAPTPGPCLAEGAICIIVSWIFFERYSDMIFEYIWRLTRYNICTTMTFFKWYISNEINCVNRLDLNDFTRRAEATRDHLGVNLKDHKKPQCQGKVW